MLYGILYNIHVIRKSISICTMIVQMLTPCRKFALYLSGDKLTVLEKKKDGWWKGEKDGVTGYFPSNYVSEGDLSPSPTTPSPTTPSAINSPTFNLPQNNGTQQQSSFHPDDVSLNFNLRLILII